MPGTLRRREMRRIQAQTVLHRIAPVRRRRRHRATPRVHDQL